MDHERNRQADRQTDRITIYGNTAQCTVVHRAAKMSVRLRGCYFFSGGGNVRQNSPHTSKSGPETNLAIAHICGWISKDQRRRG